MKEISAKLIELEKKVILQEIVMSDDTPEEIIYDYLFESVYARHPLGRQILGKSGTVQRMTQKRIFDFYKKFYHKIQGVKYSREKITGLFAVSRSMDSKKKMCDEGSISSLSATLRTLWSGMRVAVLSANEIPQNVTRWSMSEKLDFPS